MLEDPLAGGIVVRHDVVVPSDHFQFYMGDREIGPLAVLPAQWAEGEAMLVLAGDLIAVATLRFGGKTRVQVEVGASESQPQGWTDLGRFVLELSSGQLVFWAPETDDLRRSPTIAVEPGTYAGRLFSRGTDDIVDEMDEEGPDEYRIVIRRIADG